MKKFIYRNPNKSGIGDRLLDLILVYTYSKYLNCSSLYLNWHISKSEMVEHNNIYSKIRKSKTPFREFDYLLENLQKYIILPKDIIFVSKQEINKSCNEKDNFVFKEHLCLSTLYNFMNNYIKEDKRKSFEKSYFDNFNKIKFKNIPKEICDYFKNNEVVTVHLRRGDKVVNDGGTTNNITESSLSSLDKITIDTINKFYDLNYRYFNFISDEKKVRDHYISLFKNKINCKIFNGDQVSQTYYDIYCLVNSKKIILSQVFSAFSIFSSMINKADLYFLIDHPKMISFAIYKNIHKFNNNSISKINISNKYSLVNNFDINKYNFKELLIKSYTKKFNKNVKLDEIHDILNYPGIIKEEDRKYYSRKRMIGKDDRKCIFTKIFYEYYDNNNEFKNLYYKFLKEVVKPIYFPNEKYIVVQTTPNIRLQLPNTTTLGKLDTDPKEDIIGIHNDSQFNHDESEYNFILAVTKMFGTNTIQFEPYPNSNLDFDKYSKVELNENQFGNYYLNKCLHYNKINKTNKTRISFDFRIIPFSKYSESSKITMTSKNKLIIGDYFTKI
jgi:hypothetical protein